VEEKAALVPAVDQFLETKIPRGLDREKYNSRFIYTSAQPQILLGKLKIRVPRLLA